MHRNYYIVYLLLLVCAFTACTPRSIREAQSIVAQADSLWHEGKIYGVDEDDSATLAQAYEAFRHFPLSCGEGRGEVAYHYGKLLRAKENPVEAMQAFISATHSGTKDYHILGRVYSNMGDICHLASEFQLSYDMFERSAEMFLRNGDTLLYYYGLNNMAFELAEQGKKEEAMSITNKIYENCRDEEVLVKVLETQSIAYKKSQQYDSAIYYAHLLLNYNYNEPIGYLICAQAYSYKEKKDSAVFYAQKVLEKTNQLDEINNALYVLTNADETKVLEDVRQIAAYRSDVQKLLEIRQGKLSQAVQLLEQDLARKPDYQWLYVIMVTLVIVGTCIYIYVYRKRRQHQLLSQQVEDLRHETESIQERHEQIVQAHSDYKKIRMSEIENNCATITAAETFPKNIHWSNFEDMCKIMDDNFYMLASRLHQRHVLNETEIRLCILVLLNLSRTEISNILPYALSGVGKLKDQTAKKLGTTGKNLWEYLLKMTIEEC